MWAHEKKVGLTPQEVIIVAHAHLLLGLDQHVLAGMYGVNQGRINEAVKVMQDAAEHHRDYYRALVARNGQTKGEKL